MIYEPVSWVRLNSKEERKIEDWRMDKLVYGVAGISNPNNFSSQGFPALDYLLHGIASSESDILDIYLAVDNSFEINNHLKYLKLVSNQMLELTNIVIDDWENSYRDTFVSSTENTATSLSLIHISEPTRPY